MLCQEFVAPQADDIGKFTNDLQKAVDAKLSGKSNESIGILGEDNEAEESEDDDTI